MQDFFNGNGAMVSVLFLAGQKGGTTKMRSDGGRSTARSQEVDELGKGSQNRAGLVRGGASDGLLEVTWAQTRWTWGRAIGGRSDSLIDY